MCSPSSAPAVTATAAVSLLVASADHAPTTSPPSSAAGGTRRRRLWELESRAHCPLIGVCLPMAALRRLAGKVLGGHALDAGDYELHTGVVGECRSRNRLSEALQKCLDERHPLLLQRAARMKTPQQLAAWWQESSAGPELPGALWAVLTHPRCTAELEHAVLGQIHMLQHQLGMATRVDLERFGALIDENAVLARELAGAQARSTRQAADFSSRVEALESELVRQRAATVARETELDQLRERLAELERAAPGLGERHALSRECRALRGDLQDLQRALTAVRDEAARSRLRLRTLQTPTPAMPPMAARARDGAPLSELPDLPLADRSVLCVGGRPASVPRYRVVVEKTGGRFLHHDGGDEDNAGRLDATLAAADLVICQTGCVSHGAYWRVKDHCKRTGKRCVFVDTPSRAALERALADVVSGPCFPQRAAPQAMAGEGDDGS